MRRLTSWIAVLTIVYALVSAPLFHVHDLDDHGNPQHLVHAHFAELAHADELQGPEVKGDETHHEARWTDVFTFAAPVLVSYIVIDVSETIPVSALAERASIVSLDAPTAHSPPDVSRKAPRAPPAI